MNPKAQEFQFVEWSRSVSAENYDVARVIEVIKNRTFSCINVLDVGGGIGTTAVAIAKADPRCTVDVVENSILAHRDFVSHDRVNLVRGDYLATNFSKKYDFILFRTVLHHLISDTDTDTRIVQAESLRKARKILAVDGAIFVVENFYEPLVGEDLPGRLIFFLTSLKTFASFFRKLGANTAGEGVRFRSLRSWMSVIAEAGLELESDLVKQQWGMPIWQRVPFLCVDRYQALIQLKPRTKE